MKPIRVPSLVLLALLIAGICLIRAEDTPSGSSSKSDSAATPIKAPSLRKPGFVFMEFGTPHVEEYLAYFEAVADFKLTYRKSGYLMAQSQYAELTFIDPKYWASGHVFSGKMTGSGQGVGIEIGVVVADLDKSFAAAQQFQSKGWPISTGIVRRPWGVRDFRVVAPDGYYFRFTEGHSE
jgi:hypothetical protein